MRPKKNRNVECVPGQKYFRPKCKSGNSVEFVILEYDEYETIRLADFVGLGQEEVATRMQIHRSTVSRMLASGRKKIADALTNNKVIQIRACC